MSNKISFDNVLLVFAAILLLVSIVSAFQLNALSEKIASFKEASSTVSVNSQTTESASLSDDQILEKLSSAPDMVGGC
jgi:uncharacterized protein (UPF0333 family)